MLSLKHIEWISFDLKKQQIFRWYLHVVLIMIIAIFPSCSQNDEEIIDYSKSKENKLTIKISSLQHEDSASDADDAEDRQSIEIIKSLRLVLTDATSGGNAILVNEFIEFDEPKATNGFSHKFEKLSIQSGKTNAYVIANEESISSYQIEGHPSYPDETLHQRLNRFLPGNSGFDEFITSLYFMPDYTCPVPQSCCYQLDIKDGENTASLYLVNVATKFEINFYNYRLEKVVFKNISIDGIADQNYLMAKIDEKEKIKSLNGQDYYWIDWLQAVAEDTNKYPSLTDDDNSNDLINDSWGWLTEYYLPSVAEHSSISLIEKEGSESWEVNSGTAQNANTPIPGKLSKGPFYFPESRHIPSSEKKQLYSLNFEIDVSTADKEETKTFKEELGYLTALFRNTHVRVNVEMYTGPMDIYVEILKWKETDPIYGKITPE